MKKEERRERERTRARARVREGAREKEKEEEKKKEKREERKRKGKRRGRRENKRERVCQASPHTHTTTTTTRLRQVGDPFSRVLLFFVAESSGQPSGAARRRRERRLRSMLRHEQQTVRMALAAALHHSAGLREKVEKQQNGAPRGQKTAARAREGVEHELYEGLRAQKPPLPGKRPGLPPEPEPLGGAVTVGYVAAPAPLLAVPLLASAAGEAVDHSTLQFLLKHAIETKKALEEEERRRKVEEAIARLRAKVDAGEPLSASEHAAWYGTSSSSTGKRRKKKKRKRRKLPKAPLPRCRRPCAHQRQVPAVQVVHVLEGAPASVHRQSGGHSCVECRDVYPQCELCRRPSRFYRCCSWTVPPPDIGGVGFGSSPNLDTNHTFYELSLPSERGSLTLRPLCAVEVFASLCRVVVEVSLLMVLIFLLGTV